MTETPTRLDENRDVQDKAYDLLMEMLLEKQTCEMLDGLEAEKQAGATAEMDAFFAAVDAKNIKTIEQLCRKSRRKKLWHSTLPRIGRAAATIVAVATLTGGVALASSPTLRVHVLKLLLETTAHEYSTLTAIEDEAASFQIPADWQGNHYPAYVPNGLEIRYIDSESPYHSVDFVHPETDKRVLTFLETALETTMNLDTEDALVDAISINGYEGYIIEKGERLRIVWTAEDAILHVITIGMEKEEAIRIAEQVIRIK